MKNRILVCFSIIVFTSFSQAVDGSGNVYSTTKIGNQVWLTENLRTTFFMDNTPIACVLPEKTWAETTKPAYCYYGSQVENEHNFGLLYNGYCLDKNICPQGFHVPTVNDWQTLICFVGDERNAGQFLKGEKFWVEKGFGMDEYGFNALPGGGRKYTGKYYELGESCVFWTSDIEQLTEGKSENQITFQLYYWNNNVIPWFNRKQEGYSIRCVQD